MVYTISDGGVENWADIKDAFVEGAKRHHYVHLQIGRKTPMYEDLKSAGLKTILDDGTNASRVLIDFTQKEIYGQNSGGSS